MYGLKEKNLAKTYIKLIPLGSKDPDAIRLLNWKRPSGKYVRHGGSMDWYQFYLRYGSRQDPATFRTCFTRS
jgi:hypothetical protein